MVFRLETCRDTDIRPGFGKNYIYSDNNEEEEDNYEASMAMDVWA